ncbi:hypothetical protein FALBO_2217 [Fusarium albosuccineum]|uniref:Zn(2)-C6 fungal-type domain-containing protein n=1 Tax=Fusarium albosuccineum TaxID=1237068 RepID=A0A8H4PLN0_9HYPO|nr:hypothetical protein FALBO_2217 [Fusarium albosuccineum]
MLYKILAVVSAIVTVAQADFLAFCGITGNGGDGAGFGTTCMFFNNPPSCADAFKSPKFYHQEDVGQNTCGGIRCKGCDGGKNPRDWAISELEINNSQKCMVHHLYWGNAGTDPHFTIYSDMNTAGIHDVDGKRIGECTIIKENNQILDCIEGIQSGTWKHHFSFEEEVRNLLTRGYSTIRHLKCDEEKPSCRRCRKDCIQCDGYAPPNSTPRNKRHKAQASEPLLILGVSHIVSDTPLERRYFHHFYHWTCRQLSIAPNSSNFWIRHVLPLSHNSEPVKHAVTAVGAAHQFFMAGYNTRSPDQMHILTLQYTKAVSHIIPQMSVDSVYNIQCSLVCYLLFIAFEGILGRYTESIRHLRAGNHLLTLPALASSKRDHPLTRKLDEIFSALSYEASTFIDESIIPETQQDWVTNAGNDMYSGPFHDLEEASYELRQLNLRFTKITKEDFRRLSELDDEDQESGERANASFEDLRRRFKQWINRFQLTATALEHQKHSHPTSQQLLSLDLSRKFWCMNAYFAPELPVNPTADFLDAAELLAHSLAEQQHFTFSLDGDLISGLSFVVRVCPNIDARQRALNLLRSLNRREGIWDSREIAEMHEATLALDDPEVWYEREVTGGLPGYVAELAKASTTIDSANSILLAAGFISNI